MSIIAEKLICYHCGEDCTSETIRIAEKFFCCEGCKLVFEILNENQLCTYYQLNSNPGNRKKIEGLPARFDFLDNVKIQQELTSFKDDAHTHINLYIPGIHCSSCLWLLENLPRINSGICSTRVDFFKKEINIVFDHHRTSVREIAEHLTDIGYEPSIQLDIIDKRQKKNKRRSRIYRIGLTGFCFGNIMMLSFPEYFSGGIIIEPGLKNFFGYLNLVLAIPVLIFGSSEFFINTLHGIKQRVMSIDVPIAAGIAAMFVRSSYEILSKSGTGYFDSMSGLVFFMLIGRNFQEFTFDFLSFERDYKSYFPLAVTQKTDNLEKPVQVNKLKINDEIIIHNNEIIPVDSVLLNGDARIDYSFVTGESLPVKKTKGEIIFAGGKQTSGLIDLSVLRPVNQSHLTQLWNKTTAPKTVTTFQRLVRAISKWFIIVTLLIAVTAALYWIYRDDNLRALNAFTAVLVIACPCALALSAPFTFGNMLRILGKHKIFLRSNEVIEKLADVDTIVFDKTGTLTISNKSTITFIGIDLIPEEKQMIYSLARQSTHHLSKAIAELYKTMQPLEGQHYHESIGSGIAGVFNQQAISIGNATFCGVVPHVDENEQHQATQVFVKINDDLKGYYLFQNTYRPEVEKVICNLKKEKYQLLVLSGDNKTEESNLRKLFGSSAQFYFNQSPLDKLNVIRGLQNKNCKVLMIGDGLNDAGALRQSNVGLSLSDDTNNFTPASDGIIDAKQFKNIASILNYSRMAMQIIVVSFVVSLLYNAVGLGFAVTGTLSPLIAAILMPVSTVSLVLFTVLASSHRARVLTF